MHLGSALFVKGLSHSRSHIVLVLVHVKIPLAVTGRLEHVTQVPSVFVAQLPQVPTLQNGVSTGQSESAAQPIVASQLPQSEQSVPHAQRFGSSHPDIPNPPNA